MQIETFHQESLVRVSKPYHRVRWSRSQFLGMGNAFTVISESHTLYSFIENGKSRTIIQNDHAAANSQGAPGKILGSFSSTCT